MTNIVGIIDMDGWNLKHEFHCRELGMIAIKNGEVTDNEAISLFFGIDIKFADLTEKERTVVRYVQKYIHGLPLGDDGFKQDALDTIILEFYTENRKDEDSAIVYKGGNIEKDLLERLNIPHINLETLGCPKAKDLLRINKEETKHIKSCREHRLLKPKWDFDERDHCPKCEVEAYAIWLEWQKCEKEAYQNWLEEQS